MSVFVPKLGPALIPIYVLSDPISYCPAKLPKNVFPDPLTTDSPALYPNATLLLVDCNELSALYPIAMFASPEVSALNAPAPNP